MNVPVYLDGRCETCDIDSAAVDVTCDCGCHKPFDPDATYVVTPENWMELE